MKSVATVFRTASEYQVFTKRYLENPAEDIFQDRARVIYDSKTPAGRAFKGVFLPPEYRKENLAPRQIQEIREKHASKWGVRGAVWLKAGNAVNVASNLGAIYLCLKEDGTCGPQELTTFGGGAVSSGAYYVGMHYQGKGNAIVGQLAETQTPESAQSVGLNAYKSLNVARRTFIVMNVAEVIGGSAKVGIEGYHALAEPENFSFPAAVDGGLHVGLGGSWFIYNNYLAREAARYASSPATMNKAIDVLWVHARVIPPKILWASRAFGATGPLISSGVGVYNIHQGLTDGTLDSESKKHKIVSGTLGVGSSLCFVGFAFFMTPASVPIGTTLFAAGLGLLAIQTAYDEFGNVIDFYGRRIEPHVSNPFPSLYEVHLRKTQVAQASEQKNEKKVWYRHP